MENARSVIIVPGYGMAVAQAQHALREMCDMLKAEGVKVRYAIHPVAGRMPGHMNVLLAEANVPYDESVRAGRDQPRFRHDRCCLRDWRQRCDQPGAKTDPEQPDLRHADPGCGEAGTVLFVKRSLSPGYAGVDNDCSIRDNTMMLFDDAKKMSEDIVNALQAI